MVILNPAMGRRLRRINADKTDRYMKEIHHPKGEYMFLLKSLYYHCKSAFICVQMLFLG